MFNRRIRKADLKEIDFSKKPAREIPLDKVQEQEIKDITELVK
jgi:choloylglycine hydrolase